MVMDEPSSMKVFFISAKSTWLKSLFFKTKTAIFCNGSKLISSPFLRESSTLPESEDGTSLLSSSSTAFRCILLERLPFRFSACSDCNPKLPQAANNLATFTLLSSVSTTTSLSLSRIDVSVPLRFIQPSLCLSEILCRFHLSAFIENAASTSDALKFPYFNLPACSLLELLQAS